MKQDSLKFITYKISGDDTLLDDQNHITPEVRHIIEELRPEIEKGQKHLIKKLNKLCLQYPKIPVFKNFLSTVYHKNGNPEQGFSVNQWLLKEHPDYLFGRLNLATELLSQNEPEKIPEILGKAMEISELYPERKEFHLEEVIGFNFISTQYFLAIDKIEEAENRVQLMKDIDKEHFKTLYASQLLQKWITTRAVTRREKEDQLRKTVKLKDNRSHCQTLIAPVFHFPEPMGWLYDNDLSLGREKVQHILNLDYLKITEDLEKVLNDSIVRFNHFTENSEIEGYANKNLDFPIHALLLLSELKSENSLPIILQLMKQDQDFQDFWFGDFIGDVMENALYYCGNHKIELLFEFLKLPNIHYSNKSIVGESLVKIIKDSEEKRQLFINQFREVLKVYIENPTDENFVDTEAIGFVISDITDLGYKELLPEIKQLFDLEIVGYWICGTYEEVKKDIVQPFEKNMKFIKKDIIEKYEELSGYEKQAADLPQDDFSKIYNQELLNRALLDDDFRQPIVKPEKVGRNEPCPCGSGKKYKKCCLNK